MPTTLPFPAATSSSCDVGVTQTVLDYYQKSYTDRSLSTYLKSHPYGSLATEIADCLLKHGIQPLIRTANPSIFSTAAWEKFALALRNRGISQVFTQNEFERVIKNGVYVSTVPPTLAEIEKELAEHRPVIISFISPAALEQLDDYFHYAVLIGQNGEMFQTIDSFPQRTPSEIPKTLVFNELLNVASGNPNAGLVIFTRLMPPVTATAPTDEKLPELEDVK